MWSVIVEEISSGIVRNRSVFSIFWRGEGGLEMLNWCAGASYYRWCRNMHSLLKTLTAMVAIVIVFMQIVTVVMVRFQLFLQSTFKSQHFSFVKWLPRISICSLPFLPKDSKNTNENEPRMKKREILREIGKKKKEIQI